MRIAIMWMSQVKKHDDFDLESELRSALAYRKQKYPHDHTNICWVNPKHLEKEIIIDGVTVKPDKTVPVIHLFLAYGVEK